MNINNALWNVHTNNPTQANNMNTSNMHNAYVGNKPTQKCNKPLT